MSHEQEHNHQALDKTEHVHRCMSCGEQWFCPIPEHCQANDAVMPSIILRGPSGPQVFDHVCQRNKGKQHG